MESLWLDLERHDYVPIEEDLSVDVAVVGAGIFGLSAALALKRDGARVAVLEARRIGDGVTGHTTAKLSSLHGLTYERLASSQDDDTARAYGELNEAGIARVADLVAELSIDCDFRRKPNFTYAASAAKREAVEREAETAARLGLPASFVEDTDLPYETPGAVRFADQAEFHPLRYLQALAAEIDRDDCSVHERSRVVGIDRGERCVVHSEAGPRVNAGQVVIATHLPILDRGYYFARTSRQRSYGLAARVAGDLPEGMYLSTSSESLRTAPHRGGELLIVAGQGHESGHGDTAERYRSLERWARERFEVEAVDYAWAAQDSMPADGLPFIGRLWPTSDRLWTATGFRKWGLAAATTAATMVADAIAGRDDRRLEVFDPARIGTPASLLEAAKHNAWVGIRFAGDRLRRGSAADLAPGEGRIVSSGLGQRAVYRDDDGELHSLSARCTHLGCIVAWNSGDRSWDCPCHGSRFGIDGAVIEGPATDPLQRKPI